MIGMKGSERNTTILIAEDDPDDRLLIKDAFEEARLNIHLRFVEDGDDLMAGSTFIVTIPTRRLKEK